MARNDDDDEKWGIETLEVETRRLERLQINRKTIISIFRGIEQESKE